jgi:hypothetical protein
MEPIRKAAPVAPVLSQIGTHSRPATAKAPPGAAPTGGKPQGIPNPLAAVNLINALVARAQALEVEPFVSDDFEFFATERYRLRNEAPSPMFDPLVGRLTGKAFWLGARNRSGEVVSLQAYRLDYVDTTLAEWAVGWMAGLYMKRHELMVPAHLEPPSHSRAARVSGKVVYHGEIWLMPNLRSRGYFDTLPFLGMMLAYVKWQPDAVWGLVNDQMATHGHVTRMSYPHIERSFLRWQECPAGIPNNEWLVLAERSDLDYLVEERAATGA